MRQLPFEGELAPPRPRPIYLLDTSCIVRLDNKDRLPPNLPEFDNNECDAIWRGLEKLTEEGRLKLIKQVKSELKDWHPEGLNRLKGYKGHSLIIRRDSPIVKAYQQLVVKYRSSSKIGPKPGRDKADAWLLAVSQIRGFTIVTQELALERRTLTAKKDLRIPDICKLEGLAEALDLRALGNHEGWLSNE